MKKVDILASLIIGIASALLATLIFRLTSWQDFPVFGQYPLLMFIVFPVFAIGMIFVANIMAKKIPVIFQITKCFLAGVLNTFIDLGILNVLMWFFQIFGGWYWRLFKVMSFTVGAASAYFWNKYWTFEKKETKPGAGEFGKLYLITGIGLFLNVTIASIVVDVIGPQFGMTKEVWSNIGAGIAVFVVFIWNFAGYKFIVFKK